MSLRRSSRIAGVGGDVSPGSSTTSSVGRVGSPSLSKLSKKKLNVDPSILELVAARRRTLRGHSESDSLSVASAVTGSTLKGSSRQSSPEKAKGSPRDSSTGRSIKSDATSSELHLSHNRRSIAKSPTKQHMGRRTLRSRIIETSTNAQSQETEQQQKDTNSGSEGSDEQTDLNTTVVAKLTNKSAETTPVKDQKANDNGPEWDSPQGTMRLELEKMWQAPGTIKDSPYKKIASPPSNPTVEQSENKEEAAKTKLPAEQKLQVNTSAESQQSSPIKRNLFSAPRSSDEAIAEILAATKSSLKIMDEQKSINTDDNVSDASTELFIDECVPLETNDTNKQKLKSPTKFWSSAKSCESDLEKEVENKVVDSPKKLSPIKEAHEQLLELSPKKRKSDPPQINTPVSSSPRRSASGSPSKASNLPPSGVNKSLLSTDKIQKELNKSEISGEGRESNTQKNGSSSALKINLGNERERAEKLQFLGVEIEESSDSEDTYETAKKKTSTTPKKLNKNSEVQRDVPEILKDIKSKSSGTSIKLAENDSKEVEDVCSKTQSPKKSTSPVKSVKTSALNESVSEEKIIQPAPSLDNKSPRKSINFPKSDAIEETESDQSEIEVENVSPKKSVGTPVARILPQSKTEDRVVQPARKSVVQDSLKSPAKLLLQFTEKNSNEVIANLQVKNKSPEKSLSPVKRKLDTPIESEESELEEIEVQQTRKSNEKPKSPLKGKETTPIESEESEIEEIEVQQTRKSNENPKSPLKGKVMTPIESEESEIEEIEVQQTRKSNVKSKSPLKGKVTTPIESEESDIEEIEVQQTRKSSNTSTNLNNSKSNKKEDIKSPAKSKTPQRNSLQNSNKMTPSKVNLAESSESEVDSDSNTASKPINWRNKLEQKYKVKSNLAESSEDSDEEYEESASGEDSEEEQTDEQYEEMHVDDDSLESVSDEDFKSLKTNQRSEMSEELTAKEILGGSGGSSASEDLSDGNSSNSEEDLEKSPKNVPQRKKKLEKKHSTKSNLSHYFEEPDSDNSESDEETRPTSFKPMKSDWRSDTLRDFANKEVLVESSSDSEAVIDEESESVDSSDSESDEETRLASFKPMKSDWRSDTLRDFANKEVIVESSSDSEAVIDEELESVDSSDVEEVTPTVSQPMQADWISDKLKSLSQNNNTSSETSDEEFEIPTKKKKTQEISSAKKSQRDAKTGAIKPIGETKIPRSSSNYKSSFNVTQISNTSGSCDAQKSQKVAQKRKASNSPPVVKRAKLQQWTILDDSDKNTRDIWGGKIVTEVVTKKKTKETPELRQLRQLELNKQLKALRNWQVTPVSPEKHTQHEQSKTKQLQPAKVQPAPVQLAPKQPATAQPAPKQPALKQPAPVQQSESKKKGKRKKKKEEKAQTNLDTSKLPCPIKDLQNNKKDKISDDVSSSDSEPIEQSFEMGRKSAFQVMQEAMQSVRSEEEAKKKKRRERHERLLQEKLSQQDIKNAGKASKKVPQDKSKKANKLSNVNTISKKLPSSVLQQLEDNSKDGETQNQEKKIKKQRIRKKPINDKKNDKKNVTTITNFDVADPQKVHKNFSQRRADKWREDASREKKKLNPGPDMKLLKGKLEYLKKTKSPCTW